jgi:NhaP-type Na+/H+ or K+/H+ antiporter
MFFLISALAVGCAVTHILMMPAFEAVQQTVLLFVIGLGYAFIMEPLAKHAGAIGESYNMWMYIDPHLLLFTLLPPLVTGDAMTIDTSVAARVAKQCLYLGGPGVAINGFATAAFLYSYLPYDWPFLLCLVTGAILCATDPVAVVGLLKELGASPKQS